MFAHPHATVWIDHREARILHVDREQADERRVLVPARHVSRHSGAERDDRPDDQGRFFADVARAVADSAEILVVGPSTAKLQWLHWAHVNDRDLAQRIVGIETVDHPTSGELVAYARRYFHVAAPRIGQAERA